MANEAHELSISGLEVRHVPEPDETYDPEAYDDPKHVTGFVDIGAKVNGVFVVLLRRKAPGLFADIERAKDAGYEAPSDAAQSSSQSSDDTAALHARIDALQAQLEQSQQTPPEQSQQTPPEQSQ